MEYRQWIPETMILVISFFFLVNVEDRHPTCEVRSAGACRIFRRVIRVVYSDWLDSPCWKLPNVSHPLNWNRILYQGFQASEALGWKPSSEVPENSLCDSNACDLWSATAHTFQIETLKPARATLHGNSSLMPLVLILTSILTFKFFVQRWGVSRSGAQRNGVDTTALIYLVLSDMPAVWPCPINTSEVFSQNSLLL